MLCGELWQLNDVDAGGYTVFNLLNIGQPALKVSLLRILLILILAPCRHQMRVFYGVSIDIMLVADSATDR